MHYPPETPGSGYRRYRPEYLPAAMPLTEQIERGAGRLLAARGTSFPEPRVPLAPFLRASCGQVVRQSDPRTPRRAQQSLVIAPASIGADPSWAPGGTLNRYRTFGPTWCCEAKGSVEHQETRRCGGADERRVGKEC